jgi:hypothetical protein
MAKTVSISLVLGIIGAGVSGYFIYKCYFKKDGKPVDKKESYSGADGMEEKYEKAVKRTLSRIADFPANARRNFDIVVPPPEVECSVWQEYAEILRQRGEDAKLRRKQPVYM